MLLFCKQNHLNRMLFKLSFLDGFTGRLTVSCINFTFRFPVCLSRFKNKQGKMAAKCGSGNSAATTTYRKLDNPSLDENGIINELANEVDDNFSEVFSLSSIDKTSRVSPDSASVSEGEDDADLDNQSGTSSSSNIVMRTTPSPTSESSAAEIPCNHHASPSNNSSSRKRSVLKRAGEAKSKSSTLQKRVSFSSVPSERRRRVSSAADCFQFMQNGSDFLKLRPGGRQYHRFYQLEEDLEHLKWTPSAKKHEKARLPIDILYEIRTGRNTTVFKDQGMQFLDERCFSLIVGPNYDSIDLVAKSSDEANIWITGLRLLTQRTDIIEEEEDMGMREKWLKQQFRLMDKEKSGELCEDIVYALLKKLRVNAPQQLFKQKFLEASSNSSVSLTNHIDENDFVKFFIDLTTRQEIYFILVKYSSNGEYLTTDDLIIFLETEQGISWAGKEYSLDIINRCEPTEEGRKKQILGLDGLTKYFSEKDCHILEPEHQMVCEDMRKPLSHYFIASSHNTYLLDDQIKGRSSIEGYISSLQRGCRCVELDCWDGPNNEPIIYHGHTLTSKILFRDAVEAISKYAFVRSQYPLILSMENHCSLKQQDVMAKYLKEIFGDALYRTPVNESLSYLPSPESLKGKVIVKNKKLPRNTSNSVSDVGEISEEEEDDALSAVEQYHNRSTENGSHDNIAFQKSNGQPKTHRSMSTDQTLPSGKMLKLSSELSDLVNLCKSVRFQSFQQSFEKQKYWEICSIGETNGRRLCHTCPEEFVIYNKKFLSRIYPAAKRMDSSNYNPVEFWNCGCQLVALNYQYTGLAMDLNRGRFLKNGQCGYTLKPAVMREEVAYFSPTMTTEIPGVSPLTLQIKIVSGFQLPKPRGSTSKGDAIDPYVMLELYGLPVDCSYERSRTVPYNGYNPIFDETFEFRIMLPELALLRFVVLDDEHIGDCFIGQFTIPVSCIRQGYRTVYLLNNVGESLGQASLFVHVSILQESDMMSKSKGFSISKTMKKKGYTSLKSLGMKIIDDTFKLSIEPLREATILRENFQVSLNKFKEFCGLTPRSTIKQCIRILANRINMACEKNENLKILFDNRDEVPSLNIEGDVPTVLQKVLDSLQAFLGECKEMKSNASNVYERLTHSRRSALEWHSDLLKKCSQEGYKERRTNKILENFSWNIKILSGQADLLKTADQRCEEQIQQIKDVTRVCKLAMPIEET